MNDFNNDDSSTEHLNPRLPRAAVRSLSQQRRLARRKHLQSIRDRNKRLIADQKRIRDASPTMNSGPYHVPPGCSMLPKVVMDTAAQMKDTGKRIDVLVPLEAGEVGIPVTVFVPVMGLVRPRVTMDVYKQIDSVPVYETEADKKEAQREKRKANYDPEKHKANYLPTGRPRGRLCGT